MKDKKWIKSCLSERVEELNEQIKRSINRDEYCKHGKSNYNRVSRSLLIKDRNICLLLLDVLNNKDLSDEADDGLRRLTEPRKLKC